jgi:hypothetical protein
MGAVASLLFDRFSNLEGGSSGRNENKVCAMVLDSPFASFARLAKDLVNSGQVSVPQVDPGSVHIPHIHSRCSPLLSFVLRAQFLFYFVLRFLRKSIVKKSGLDIYKLNPIDMCERFHTPVYFGVATDDLLIKPDHSRSMLEIHGATLKSVEQFDGHHNSPRPEGWYHRGLDFIEAAIREEDERFAAATAAARFAQRASVLAQEAEAVEDGYDSEEYCDEADVEVAVNERAGGTKAGGTKAGGTKAGGAKAGGAKANRGTEPKEEQWMVPLDSMKGGAEEKSQEEEEQKEGGYEDTRPSYLDDDEDGSEDAEAEQQEKNGDGEELENSVEAQHPQQPGTPPPPISPAEQREVAAKAKAMLAGAVAAKAVAEVRSIEPQ